MDRVVIVPNLIYAVLVAVTFALLLTRPKVGAFVYLGAILLAPAANIAGLTPRIELVLVPLGLFARVLAGERAKRPPRIALPLVLFAVWLIWIGFATIISPEAINWIGSYGFARLVGVSLLFFSIPWNEEDIIRAQWIFVVSAVPIALLTIGQLAGFGWAMTLTNSGYSPSTSAVISLQQSNMSIGGSIFRGVGVFGNVSPAAAYFVLVIGIGLLLAAVRQWSARQNVLLFVSIMFAFLGGFATLSATFFGGVTAIWIVALIVAGRRVRTVVGKRVVFWFGLFLLAGVILVAQDEEIQGQVRYQIGDLLTGERFASRYGVAGIADEAWRYVINNPILGAGLTKTSIFAGDSLYLSLLFPGGFVGGFLFLIPVVMLLWLGWRGNVGSRIVMAWTLGVLVIGVSCDGMLIARLGDWWWAMQGMLLAASIERRALLSAAETPSKRDPYIFASRVRPL
jgi:hypothetical protein